MSEPKKLGEETFYRRNLPHLQPPNAVLFITIRLDGSLPKKRVQELKEQREAEEEELIRGKGLTEKETQKQLLKKFNLYFGKFDELLVENKEGPHWLKEKKVAKIWEDALKHFDNERYKLICSTIMSNHVHFIFYKLTQSLASIMHSLKSYSSTISNKFLNRVGQKFWQAESFDRLIRDRAELKYRINYTLNNAVEAGLVNHWRGWQYNYIHPDFLKFVD